MSIKVVLVVRLAVWLTFAFLSAVAHRTIHRLVRSLIRVRLPCSSSRSNNTVHLLFLLLVELAASARLSLVKGRSRPIGLIVLLPSSRLLS